MLPIGLFYFSLLLLLLDAGATDVAAAVEAAADAADAAEAALQ